MDESAWMLFLRINMTLPTSRSSLKLLLSNQTFNHLPPDYQKAHAVSSTHGWALLYATEPNEPVPISKNDIVDGWLHELSETKQLVPDKDCLFGLRWVYMDKEWP